jgi:DNA-binding FadR family transcriptional regulator
VTSSAKTIAAVASADATAFREVHRGHAADDVFDQLAAAILRGELATGAELPPERVLAERFGVSRVIARQAVHRLAELGLVRVRQGGATLVLDPKYARDLRVIELFYRLGAYTKSDMRDINERQLLQGLSLLQLAADRATPNERAEIAAIADAYVEAGATEASLLAFEKRFWTAIAEAGKNRIYIFETSWWFRLLEENPRAHHETYGPPAARGHFLRELTRRLVAGDDAPAFYLQIVTPVIASFQPKRRSLPPVPPRKTK